MTGLDERMLERFSIVRVVSMRSARAVQAALQGLPTRRAIVPRLLVRQVFDRDGQWGEETLPRWLSTVRQGMEELVS